jgi:TolB-like protein/Tfp pilus assembly protein PilF
VLYFDNLSPDTADVYLAEGLTEEVIARLGGIDRLIVSSRTAAQRFRGRGAGDPAAVGRAFGVAHLVSGSVRRAGIRLRVTVELVRAATGIRVWGEQYDRSDADLLAIEADIATAVATAIAGRLLPGQRASLAARPTSNPRAYDHYLRGNRDLAMRAAPATARAIREYEAAAQLDPTFARAFARAAFGYALFPAFPWRHPTLSPDSLLARSAAAVDRALQVDSTCSDAWMVRAFLLYLSADAGFARIQAAFERAVALDPKNDEAWQLYGIAARGFDEDSVVRYAMERALSLEPQRPVTLARLAELEWIQGRHEDASRLLDSAIAIDPGFYLAYWNRALLRMGTGEPAAARSDAETALRLSAGDSLAELGLALVEATTGDTARARARVRGFWRVGRDTLHPSALEAAFAAQVYVALGEEARAFALLEGVRHWPSRVRYMLRFPTFDAVRRRPRFQRLFAAARPPGTR